MRKLSFVKRKLSFVNLFGIMVLLACADTRYEYSSPEALQETAVVESVVYTASQEITTARPTVDADGSLSLEFDNETIPEKFVVTLRAGDHSFTVDNRELYTRVKDHVRQKGTASYRELYFLRYEEKDGKKQLVERSLVRREFLGFTLN